MTADSWPGIDAPARDLQVNADRLGDAGAIFLVQPAVHTSDEAKALCEAKSDREAEIVVGGERHDGYRSPAAGRDSR